MFHSVDFISSLIATKFLALLNHKLMSSENVSGMIFLMNTVLLKFQNFALKPEVFEMGETFRLQNGLNLLSSVWTSVSRPKRRMLWSQIDA